MAEILKKYEIVVFDDGAVDFCDVTPLKSPVVDWSRCSERIKQVLLVVREMHRLREETDYSPKPSKIYSDAIVNVSRSLNVERTTIQDKLQRQLSLSAEESRALIWSYLEGGSGDLKSLLLKHIGKNTKEVDRQAIEAELA